VNPFDILTALGPPIEWTLTHLTRWFGGFGLISGSAFGFAVVAVTLMLRTALFPLFGWQVRNSRRIQAEQRLVAPQLTELRKRYRKEPRRLQEEMQKLYREHGISPFSNLTGCLPLLFQMPILYGLYRGITAATRDIHSGMGFLWIGDVSTSALRAGLAAHPAGVLLPLTAAGASFVQAKMMMQPARPDMSEQELKAYQLSKSMLFLAPGMVLLFGSNLPQGLCIYWVTQSLVMILQQWLVIGWGGLRVPRWFPGASRLTGLSYRPDGTTPVTAGLVPAPAPAPRKPARDAAVRVGRERRSREDDARPSLSSPGGAAIGRAPRSVTSRAPGARSRPNQGSARRRGRGR
jgi:YidC/Oxa1 family membrane protein insertase